MPTSSIHFQTLLTLPTDVFRRFTEWARQYGGIFSLKLGPGTAVVISSPALVKDLLDRRSTIYSSRPPSYVSNELITRGDHILTRTNDDTWRLQRKLVHQFFSEGRCEKDYLTLQNAEAVQMLRDTCLAPEQFMYHPKRFSNSIIMSLGKFVSL